MSTVMDRAERAATHQENRRRLLEENVLLLAPSFGSWVGHYQLPSSKVVVELDGEGIDNASITTPRAKLLTDRAPLDRLGKPWKKRFQELASRQERIIERFSVPFPIRGVRIVPKVRGEEFLREIEDVHRDLATTVNEFVENLEDVFEQIKRVTDPSVWEAVEHKVPKQRDQMRAKFYIDVCPVELAGGVPEAVDRSALATHYELVRAATTRKVEEAIEAIIEGPRAALAEAIANLRELIGKDGRVSDKSFRPVQAAMEKLRAFSFVADDTLLHAIQNLDHRMRSTDPKTLDRNTAVTSGFAAALNAVTAEVADAVKQQAAMESFGRELRGITL